MRRLRPSPPTTSREAGYEVRTALAAPARAECGHARSPHRRVRNAGMRARRAAAAPDVIVHAGPAWPPSLPPWPCHRPSPPSLVSCAQLVRSRAGDYTTNEWVGGFAPTAPAEGLAIHSASIEFDIDSSRCYWSDDDICSRLFQAQANTPDVDVYAALNSVALISYIAGLVRCAPYGSASGQHTPSAAPRLPLGCPSAAPRLSPEVGTTPTPRVLPECSLRLRCGRSSVSSSASHVSIRSSNSPP